MYYKEIWYEDHVKLLYRIFVSIFENAAALLRNNCLMYNLKINYCTRDYYKIKFFKSYIYSI